jgi:ParB/RepB/Spo0J family partition protein
MGQPIVVFRDYSERYWLADGYHRLQAVKKLGGKLIPAFVKYGDEESAITYGAMLNIQRGKVNPADLALFCKHLRDKCRMALEKIAASLKLSKGHVSLLLQIADNPELIEKLKRGEISLHKAKDMLYSKEGAKTIAEEKVPVPERAEIYAPPRKAETEALSEKGGKIEEISLTVKPISEEKASFAERGEIQTISKEPKIEAFSAEKPIKAEIAEAPEKAVQPKSVETAAREASRLAEAYPKELVDLAVEVAGGSVETSAVEKALRQLMDLLWQRISEDPALMNWVRSKLAELLQKHA